MPLQGYSLPRFHNEFLHNELRSHIQNDPSPPRAGIRISYFVCYGYHALLFQPQPTEEYV